MMKQAGIQEMMRAATLAVCTLAVCAVPAMAQDTMPPPPPAGQDAPMGPGGGHRGGPGQMEERQIEMLTKHLKLTPDQVTQVKAIDDAQRTQMMALRQDQTTPREDKRAKMMAMRQDTETKIRGVLTDEQKPKFDAMLAKQKERMQEHRGGHDGPDGHDGPGGPPPPPPPSL